ncbi:hypothetical protein COCCADRAFT_35941 [Bipolaris zeicola 26-R-13]|uniref:Uncharacterized protein n=1 Tax=Cochliobolus carbonum (strain 26-R-13) TaxID=930089 RepID=W6Y9Z2_COCC2|nr:uncharacterized protein COCCADRAFT_35941 [Bipolaris zeicola 26-R-13]EUC34375.1 hypothetical protein COCCADRAFT_35941 [Bipolaris zeicola 26-R-13]
MEAYITLPKGTYLVDIRYAPKENCGTAAIGYPKTQLHNQCQVPTVTCSDPVPEMCGCTCSDGAMFSHERPSHLGPSPIPPPPPSVFEPPHQLTEKPCTEQTLQPWKPVVVNRKPYTGTDSGLVNVSFEAPEDGVLVISDSHGRCEHFETSGTGPLDFSQCGLPDECMEKNGGQHGYFALPRGNYKLGLKWTKVTPECDRSSSGEGHYKFHRRC